MGKHLLKDFIADRNVRFGAVIVSSGLFLVDVCSDNADIVIFTKLVRM